MSSLFAVVVYACVNLGVLHSCDVLSSPIQYVSEQRCAGQGALLAGMYKSRFGSSAQLEYKVACVPVDGGRGADAIQQTADAMTRSGGTAVTGADQE